MMENRQDQKNKGSVLSDKEQFKDDRAQEKMHHMGEKTAEAQRATERKPDQSKQQSKQQKP